MRSRLAPSCLALALAFGTLGCNDNLLSCAISGDNLKGRITFSESVPIIPGTRITTQWSKDGFASIAGSTKTNNYDGLVTFAYSLCVESDVDLQVRSIQDVNENDAIDPGEISGRDDGTANGNATFITRHLVTGTTDRAKVEGADIVLDN